jgi:HAD superfamily hydrolase (TIGR01459 family)
MGQMSTAESRRDPDPAPTRLIDGIAALMDRVDAVLVDQWGVLHAGSDAFPPAVAALRTIAAAGKPIVVLSNSGRRAAPNAARMIEAGVPAGLVEAVVTSGEVLWRCFAEGRDIDGLRPRALHVVARTAADVAEWFDGLTEPRPVAALHEADAILVLSLPDGLALDDFDDLVRAGLARGLPMICANPDRVAPRDGGRLLVSSGALAARYAEAGGTVRSVGKPCRTFFEAAIARFTHLPCGRILMIGDSMEHDVAGGAALGLSTLFVCGGIHRPAFERLDDPAEIGRRIARLAREHGVPPPDFAIDMLR